MRSWRVFGFAAVLTACYSPTVHEGAPCPDGACPSSLMCDPVTVTCVRTPGATTDAMPDDDANTACPPGHSFDGNGCVDIDECTQNLDDCHTDATCTNSTGSFSCACNPGFTGTGQACMRACSRVLIYDDCIGPADADCATIPEAQFADNAAVELGMQVSYGTPGDEAAFRSLFDAGGFEVLIIESSLNTLAPASASRIADWVNAGGRTIVSFWDLDNTNVGSTLRTALEVSTTGEITTPRDVHHDPTSTVNFFNRLETLPSPLTFTHLMVDDGDELTLASAGFIAARHTSSTGAGAIAVTRNNRAITLGFVPVGLVFQGPRDADADGKPDVRELYTNFLGYLCGY